MVVFNWDNIQRYEDGRVLLLYRHERIFEEGLVKKGMCVIDVGGWGVLAKRLEEEGVSCTVLDTFSEDQYYPERVRNGSYVEGDITVWEDVCDLSGVDLITCFEMLEHCRYQNTAINNMFRLLNTNGYLVGTMPISGRVHASNEIGITFLNAVELFTLLDSAGFLSIFIEPTGSINKGGDPCSLYFKARKA